MRNEVGERALAMGSYFDRCYRITSKLTPSILKAQRDIDNSNSKDDVFWSLSSSAAARSGLALSGRSRWTFAIKSSVANWAEQSENNGGDDT